MTAVIDLAGCVLTPQGFVRGALRLSGGRVTQVTGEPVTEAAARSSELPLWLPGFIDLHVHGGGGHDTMAGGDAVAAIARTHARHGTTSLLATTMTAPRSEIEAALRGLAPHVAQRPRGAARVLGVHLEGPYINPRQARRAAGFRAPRPRSPRCSRCMHWRRCA